MGTLEIEIMNAIWTMLEANEDRNIAISDVVNFLNNNGIIRAYTTIKTVMDRLVTKGTLSRFKSGKKFFYVAAINRFEATKMSIEEISEQFFNGKYTDMIHFIEQNCISMVTI
jgi:predicted transcriptional regulator